MNLETDQLQEFYRKYKLIIWPAVVGASCLLIAALIIVPQLLVYFNLRSEADGLSNRLGLLQAKAQGLEQLNILDYNRDLDLAQAALPSEKQVPQALTMFQDLITKSGLNLQNMKFISGDVSSADATEYSFQLSVTVLGDMNSVKRLLLSMHKAPRIFRLESVSAQAVRATTDVVEADVFLKVFYEPNSTNLGSVEQPIPQLSAADRQILEELANKVRLSGSDSANFSSVQLGRSDPFE